MNLFNLLDATARRFTDQGAVFHGETLKYRYGELRDLALKLAGGFAARTAPGDRILICARNRPELLPILFGIWASGRIAVPVNAKLHEREIAEIAEDSDATLILSDAVLPDLSCVTVIGGADFETLCEYDPLAPVDVAADDIAWLFFTSGTTGRSKGAMLSHRNLMAMTIAHIADFEDLEARDAIIHAAPMSHGSGLLALPCVLRGARHVIPVSGGYDAGEFIALTHAHANCGAFLAPTMVRRLCDEAERIGRMPRLRNIVYGGGPMYVEDISRALALFGPVFTHLYGQGEAPMTITGLRRAEHASTDLLGTVGWPRSGIEVAVRRADGGFAASGERGEIVCRGDVVMQGYWRNAEATAAALRDGWLYTGDIGAIGENGALTLHGRSKEVIISGGSNIYPREIEEALLAHPAIAEACVVGARDPEWGEIVVAFVVAEQGVVVDVQTLDAHCIAHIARFKRPKRYVFVDSLPKSSNGKVLKRELASELDLPA